MIFNRRFGETFRVKALLGGTWPASATDLAWLPAMESDRFVFLAAVHQTGVDGTITLKVRQAKDASGTDAADLDATNAAIDNDVTFIDASTPGVKWAMIDVETRKMGLNSGFTHLTVSLSEAATGTITGTVFVLYVPRSHPVTQGTDCKELVYFDG